MTRSILICYCVILKQFKNSVLSGDSSYPAGKSALHTLRNLLCEWLVAGISGGVLKEPHSFCMIWTPIQPRPHPSLSKQLYVKAAKGIHINSWTPMCCDEHLWSHVQKRSCGSLWHSCNWCRSGGHASTLKSPCHRYILLVDHHWPMNKAIVYYGGYTCWRWKANMTYSQ